MPTSPFVTVQMSVSGGAPVQGGQTVAGASTIQLSLTNTSLLTSVRWEIYAYPSGWPTPSGWTLDASTGIIYSTDTTPTLITLEAATARWGKWLVRCIGNGGTKNGVPPTTDPITGSYLPNDVIDIASGWKVADPTFGLSGLAIYEGTQFGGLLRWMKDLRDDITKLVAGLSSGGGNALVQTTANDATATVTQTTGRVLQPFKNLSAPRVLNIPAASTCKGMSIICRSEDNTITDANTVTWTPAAGNIERANVSATTFVQNATNSAPNGAIEFMSDGTVWRALS